MIIHIIKCPKCGEIKRTTIEPFFIDGKTNLVHSSLGSQILGRIKEKSLFLDLNCPKCGNKFEWKAPMSLEVIECPKCKTKYCTDLDKIMYEEHAVTKGFLNLGGLLGRKRQRDKCVHLDLKCPVCEKEFEWEVNKS